VLTFSILAPILCWVSVALGNVRTENPTIGRHSRWCFDVCYWERAGLGPAAFFGADAWQQLQQEKHG
jgi:hypothetical protein